MKIYVCGEPNDRNFLSYSERLRRLGLDVGRAADCPRPSRPLVLSECLCLMPGWRPDSIEMIVTLFGHLRKENKA